MPAIFCKSKIYILDDVDYTDSCQPQPQQFIVSDSLNLQDDEPFTLDSFGSLLEAHLENGSNLIIAKVQTKTGFFYYDAHSLNKCLFRALGPRTEYLFRIMALNPLTNEEMIGDVVYYQIMTTKTISKSESSVVSNPNHRKSLVGSIKSSMFTLGTEIKVAQVIGPETVVSQDLSPLSVVTAMPLVSKVTAIPIRKTISLSLPMLKENGPEKGVKQTPNLPQNHLPIIKSVSLIDFKHETHDIEPPKQSLVMTQFRKKSIDLGYTDTKQQSQILGKLLSLDDEYDHIDGIDDDSGGKRRCNNEDGLLTKFPAIYGFRIGSDEDFLLDRTFRTYIQGHALDENLKSLIQIPVEVLVAEGIYIPDLEVVLSGSGEEGQESTGMSFARRPAHLTTQDATNGNEDNETFSQHDRGNSDSIAPLRTESPVPGFRRGEDDENNMIVGSNMESWKYFKYWQFKARKCRWRLRFHFQTWSPVNQDILRIMTWMLRRICGILALVSISMLFIGVMIGAMVPETLTTSTSSTISDGIRFVYGQIIWFSIILLSISLPIFVLFETVYRVILQNYHDDASTTITN